MRPGAGDASSHPEPAPADIAAVRRELRCALGLSATRALPVRVLGSLLERAGSWAALHAAAGEDRNRLLAGLEAEAGALSGGARAELVSALRAATPAPPDRLRELEAGGIRVAVRPGPRSPRVPAEVRYPEALLHLHVPPPLLYLRGPLPLPARRCVAVVGTRRATAYGRRMARDLSAGLAEAGWTVVSGMARGIDGEAHRAALDAGGRTVGVLGSGFDREYPASNRDLYRRMRRSGLLVSEHAPEVVPRPYFFPRRNRIIAALARAVVVVQAGRKSGALNTVSHALELGREVLAVPGPVGPEATEGVLGLLRDGAAVAATPADVLGVAGQSTAGAPDVTAGDREEARRPPKGAEDGGDGRVWGRLAAAGEASVAELAASAGVSVGDVLALLTTWELAGRVRALPGDRFQVTPS